MEIMLLFLMNIFIGVGITWLFELVLKTNKSLRERYYQRHEILFGYHVHHSTIGLLLVVLGIAVLLLSENTSSFALLGIGMGIIIMHTISSRRFVFIEKESFTK